MLRSLPLLLALACSGGPSATPDPTPPPQPTATPDATAPTPPPTEPAAPERSGARTPEVEPEEPTADIVETPPSPSPPADPTVEENPVQETGPAETQPEAEPEEPTARETAEPTPDPSPTDPEPEPEPAAQTWRLSASQSQLLVQVYKNPDTMGAGLSHDHVIVARELSGSVVWHPSDASQCALSVELPVRRLAADPPTLRAAVGLEGTLSDKQRSQVRDHMLAKGQLHASAYPTIRFVSSSCSATQGAVQVKGTLTIRGKSKPVSTTLTVDLSTGFRAEGSLRIRATDFGFEPYTALMGALKNRDEMTLRVRLVGE